MKKRNIKVIKRDAEPEPPAPPTDEEILAKQEKDDATIERDMTGVVSGWISERKEKRDAEKLNDERQFDDAGAH